MNREQVALFYDNFVSAQMRVGINVRHRTILKRCIRSGLRKDCTLLEIGCGIGTLTSLLAKVVRNGRIVAADISARSIEHAKRSYGHRSNIEWLVTDMSDFNMNIKFDFVILADVLEHIPIDSHRALFSVIRRHLHDQSKILINIPEPKLLEWMHRHNSSALQIVDQPLHSHHLLKTVYDSDLYLESLASYSLFYDVVDYQFIVLTTNVKLREVRKYSKAEMFLKEIRGRLPY